MDMVECANKRTGVIVAHPGTQHSYETALALQEANLLRWYITGFYFNRESSLGRTLRLFPNGIGAKLERELRRRFKPGLAPERVMTSPAAELLYLASTRLGPLRRLSGNMMRWRNRRFDKWVAQVLAREMPAGVICYDSCALRAFERAKSLGILCVLDQSIAHIKTMLRVLREEAQLHPEFADTLPIEVPDWLVEQCCRELELADAVLVSSAYGKQTLVEHGVSKGKIFLLPYGADVDRFKPARARNGQPFRVLFVGQLTQRKGIKYLLEAFRQLALPDAELLLVGSVVGSGRGLRRYRDAFKHISSVLHSDVHQWFLEADLFVYPSLHEGSALATYEALAAGLPVIATPNCGSVVRDGIEGFIVPIRDVEALKEKILLLYENKGLCEEMSHRARLRAEEFTWAAYRQRLERLLLHLLETRG